MKRGGNILSKSPFTARPLLTSSLSPLCLAFMSPLSLQGGGVSIRPFPGQTHAASSSPLAYRAMMIAPIPIARGRLMRRTIARYLIVALVQTLRMTSIQVKKRFPTLSHLSEAGIITENEQKIIEGLDEKCIQHPKYWMSLVWAGAIVTRAKKEGRIKDDFAFRTIIKEINKFRSGCGGLLDYDWISIPLVYTQVVALAVYTFFLSSLMGRQFLDPTKGLNGHDVDMYVPVFTFLQFFFYMGWLKVAEVLINPFGEDDDDFEMNWLIDRNLQVAYLIVDEMHAEHPELVKDQFWDEGIPDELPYTLAAEDSRPAEPWLGSTAEVEVTKEQGEFIVMDKVIEEDIDSESEAELNQIRIEDVKATVPVNIQNGKLIARSPEPSIHESMATLPVSSMGPKRGSMMSIMQKMFQGSPRMNESLNRIESVLSVNSKASNAAAIKRRRRYAKHTQGVMDRSVSKASHLSSPILSRINTNEKIFKMSDSSSNNSIHSESGCTSRRNSETLVGVRDKLTKDFGIRMEGGIETFDENDVINSPRSRASISKQKRKERAENLAHTTMLKRKLEEVQTVQVQIMKEIDDEIKLNSNPEKNSVSETIDAVNILTSQTIELRNALHSRQLLLQPHPLDTESGTASDNPSPVPEQVPLYLKEGRSSYSVPLSKNQVPNISSQNSPTEDMASHHSESLPLACFEPLKPISAANSAKNSLAQIERSHHSSADDIFDLEFTSQSKYGGHEDSSEEQSESVIANHNLISPLEEDSRENVKSQSDEYMEDTVYDPGNLGTIQEAEEYGYQSDSDTTMLIPRGRRRKKADGDNEAEEDKLPTPDIPLATVVEEHNL